MYEIKCKIQSTTLAASVELVHKTRYTDDDFLENLSVFVYKQDIGKTELYVCSYFLWKSRYITVHSYDGLL